MVTVHQPISSKLARRKERTKKTWNEIIERGIESYEEEKDNPPSQGE